MKLRPCSIMLSNILHELAPNENSKLFDSTYITCVSLHELLDVSEPSVWVV